MYGETSGRIKSHAIGINKYDKTKIRDLSIISYLSYLCIYAL